MVLKDKNKVNMKKKTSEIDRMKAGKMYNSASIENVIARTRARCLVDRFNKTHAWNTARRTHLLKKIFPNSVVNKDIFFEPSIRVEYGFNTVFGKCFFMNYDCQLLDVAPITIGDNVMFGPRVIIATPMHPLLAEERVFQEYPDGMHCLEYAKPVTIGNNVWIASNVTVCGGVEIGDNTIIGAGSVVTRSIPANVIAGGVPCKVIRELSDRDKMNPWQMYQEEK